MKRFRSILLALLALLALGALLASTASAVEGILPLKTKDFLLEGGTSTLATPSTTLPAVICEKLDDSPGVMVNDHHTEITIIHWLGCTAGGLAVNSKGANSKEILVKVVFLVCLINSSTLLFGIAAETSETAVLEIPALGLKIEVKGLVIGHVLPAGEGLAKHFTVDFEGAKGVQTVKECLNEAKEAKKHSLLSKVDAGVFESASENVNTGLVLFLENMQFMDK
jgi:hypothetical protein